MAEASGRRRRSPYDTVELPDQPQECLPGDLWLSKQCVSFGLKQLLVGDSGELHKCQHLFALLGAGSVSIDVVMGIISRGSEALISRYMCLSVISNGQMNCFVINALCLTDRNLSKYGAPEGRRGGIKESLLIKEERRAVNTVPGALRRSQAFDLSTDSAWHCTQTELTDRGVGKVLMGGQRSC